MPGGRSRSESVTRRASPPRAITIPFISVPSTNPSRIASCAGDSASAAWRCDSRSPGSSIRKTPRWPPESTGLSTAGSPTVSIAARPSARFRTAANGGCGMPSSASVAPHRDLVRHPVRDVACRSRAARGARSPRDDRHGAVGRHGQRAVDRVPSRDLLDRVDVGEVDDLGDVGELEARARRGCGRPRRREGRARAPGGSRGAGGGPRRRRGRSARRDASRGEACGTIGTESALSRGPRARVVSLG